MHSTVPLLVSFITFFSFLLAFDDNASVQAFPYCQAHEGSYAEPPARIDPDLTPVEVTVVLEYDATVPLRGAVPDPAVIASELTHRLSDALVFTLFDDCRIDAHDRMSVINMQRIDVHVTPKRQQQSSDDIDSDHHHSYLVSIRAVGDETVDTDGRETILARQRLASAVRLSIRGHHVAEFTVEPGDITLTLRPNDVDDTRPSDHPLSSSSSTVSASDTTRRRNDGMPWVAQGVVAFTLIGGILMAAVRTHRASSSSFHDDEVDDGVDDLFHPRDIELACGDVPKKHHHHHNHNRGKLLLPRQHDDQCHCDPTEVSESSSADDDDGVW